MARIATLLIVFVLNLTLSARAAEPEALQRGSEAYIAGDYSAAITQLTEAVEADNLDETSRAVAFMLRGGAYANVAKHSEAISDYTAAIRLWPENALAYARRGVAWFELGDYPAAIRDYDKAIELRPDNAFARQNKAVAVRSMIVGDRPVALARAQAAASGADPSGRVIAQAPSTGVLSPLAQEDGDDEVRGVPARASEAKHSERVGPTPGRTATEQDALPPPSDSLGKSVADLRTRLDAALAGDGSQSALGGELRAAKAQVVALSVARSVADARARQMQGRLATVEAELGQAKQQLTEMRARLSDALRGRAAADAVRAAAENALAESRADAAARDLRGAELERLAAALKEIEAERDAAEAVRLRDAAALAALGHAQREIVGERDELAARAGQLEGALAGAKKAVDAADLERAGATERAEQARTGLDGAEARIADLQEQLQAARGEATSLRGDREELRTRLAALEAATAELDALRAQNRKIAEERGRSAREAVGLREDTTRLTGRIAELESGAARSATEIAKLGDQFISSANRDRDLSALFAQVQAERDNLREALAKAHESVDPLKSELGRVRAELTAAKRHIDELTATQVASETRRLSIGVSEDGSAVLQSKLTVLEIERDDLRRQLSALKEDTMAKLGTAVENAGGPAEARAEPELAAAAERTDEGLVVVVDGVDFETENATLSPTAEPALVKIAELVVAYPNRRILIRGHTDSLGDAAYNRQLSEQRAASVRDRLIERFALDGGRITAEGLGESRPIASNGTAAGRQANRRVEVVIRN